MTETNLNIEKNDIRSVPIPLLSEEQKPKLLADLTNFDEHLEQLLENRDNATLANSTQTDFEHIASTIHSFFDNTDFQTPEMSKLFINNRTAYFAEMKRLETNRVDYNFKVVSQLVKEIEPSMSNSKALAITKVGCSAFKSAPHAVNLLKIFSQPGPAFEKSVVCATELCRQIDAIDNVYDANTNIADVAFSQISELFANPAILFNPHPEHADL